MKQSKYLLIGLGAALAVGCGHGDGDDGADEQVGVSGDPLLGAPLDPGHRFSVGICTAPLQPDGTCAVAGTPNTSRCTGTLVAPNLVLTARHCTERLGAPTTADFCSASFTGTPINAAMQITTSSSVYQPGSPWYAVQSVRTPQGNGVCTDDIALLTLARNVPDVKPASIALSTRLETHDLPRGLAIVGRGGIHVRHDLSTGERVEYDDGNLQRRKLEKIPFICAPTPAHPCTVPDYSNSPPTFEVRPGQLAYGSSAIPGDSGAGVIPQAYFERGQYRLIAVNTMYTVGPEGTSNGSQGLLLEPHANLLRATARTAAASGGYPVPNWAR